MPEDGDAVADAFPAPSEGPMATDATAEAAQVEDPFAPQSLEPETNAEPEPAFAKTEDLVPDIEDAPRTAHQDTPVTDPLAEDIVAEAVEPEPGPAEDHILSGDPTADVSADPLDLPEFETEQPEVSEPSVPDEAAETLVDPSITQEAPTSTEPSEAEQSQAPAAPEVHWLSRRSAPQEQEPMDDAVVDPVTELASENSSDLDQPIVEPEGAAEPATASNAAAVEPQQAEDSAPAKTGPDPALVAAAEQAPVLLGDIMDLLSTGARPSPEKAAPLIAQLEALQKKMAVAET